MAIGDDFEIQNDKDIRYTGVAHEGSGAGYYTVLELHQWLRGLADDASSTGDDYMDIARPTPSEKVYDTILQLLNGYNVDDTAVEHLYQGSIIQYDGDEIYDGIQVVANEGCHVEIVQNGAVIANDFWNSTPFGESTEGLNRDTANGIASRFLVKVRTGGSDTDGRRLICQTREWGMTFSEFKVNGTSRGVNVVPLTYATDLNNDTAEGVVSGWTTITNQTEGYVALDVNNDSVDEHYYSEWDRATYNIKQLYERLKYLTRRGETTGIYGIDGEIFRGVTNELGGTQSSGTFSTPESCTWSTGSGQILAVDNTTAATKVWIQLLTGTAPSSGDVTADGGAVFAVSSNTERVVSTPFCGACTGAAIIGAYGLGVEVLDLGTNDSVTALDNNPYSPPNYQNFTVGNLDGSEDYVLVGPAGYRFAYDNESAGPFQEGELLTFTSPAGTAYLAQLLDLDDYGEMYIGLMESGSPPQDNSTISGGSSSATADVDGTVRNDINLRQLTLNGALTGGAVTSVVVNETIPSDTPATGTIRIKRTSGKYTKHPYSAWDGPTKTFTITSHDFSGDNAPDDGQVFVSYLDQVATGGSHYFTSIYSDDRSLFIRVRNGGTSPIKPFETTATFGAGGGSATTVRTSDA